MIAHLSFAPPESTASGHALRRAHFRPRSLLPDSAACLVANGVRETLQRLLGASLELRVIEPQVPDDAAKSALFEGAIVYRVSGSASDAFIVLRRADALRFAGAAFGEADLPPRERLSSIELGALDRLANGIAAQCAALCGSIGTVRREPAERAQRACTTYFELRTVGALRAAIGFGLSREPSPAPGTPLAIEQLLDVGLEASVECARGTIALGAIAGLRAGDTLLLETPLDEPGALLVDGQRLAGVACGDLAGRRAVTVCAA